MPYPNLTRSLLALAIAGASLHATAIEYNLETDGPKKFDKELISGLEVTGKYDGKKFHNDDLNGAVHEGLVLAGTRVNGDVTLSGEIVVYESSNPDHWETNAFKTDDSEDDTRSVITGNLTNNGLLKVVGNGEGLEVEETDIGGQLVNKGSIEVEAQAGKDGYSGAFGGGIAIEDSTIAKGLVNEGSITLSVTGAPKPDDPYDVIELNGIEIENSSIGGTGIVNSTAGTITVTGGSEDAKTSGIMIDPIFPGFPDDDDDLADPSVISKIDNHGTITVTGSDSVGIRVNGGAKIGSLLNTGTIDGGTAGIQIEGAGTVLNVTQADGLIKGGEYAINQGKDGSKINLDLAGGKIDGNLDVNDIIVTGEGEIANSKVEAKLLTVKNDGKLTLGNGTTLATELSLAGGGVDASAFTVNSINGSGTITADAVKVNSKLLVNSGNQLDLRGNSDTITLNVANGFTVSSGGVLGLELNAGQDSSKPMVDVKGDLTFESGSTVSLSAVKGLKLDGEDYFLIQASTITADDEGLVKGTALLKVNSYENFNGELHANVSVVNDPAAIVKGAGASGNAQAAAGQVLNLIAGLEQGNAGNRGFAEMLLALDEVGLAQTVEQMTPDVDGAAASVASQGLALMSGVTSSRTSGIRGQSSGAALTEAGVWAQGLYSDARQGTRNEVAGYNAYTSGMAIGADAKVTDSLTVGVAYGYMDSTVNSKRGNTTEVDGHSFTIYGGYELDNYFVDSSLTYSKNENKSKRQILNTTAKGTYDSNTLGLSVLGGYDFKLDGMTVSPLVGMNYSNTKLDGFTEKGSAAALRSGSQRYEIAELGAGARLSASYPLGQGRLEPQVQAMVYHDFAADRAKSTSAFVNAVGGNSFIAYGAKPERTSYQADVGVDYKIGAFTVGGSYGYVGKKGFDSDTFAAKVRYDF